MTHRPHHRAGASCTCRGHFRCRRTRRRSDADAVWVRHAMRPAGPARSRRVPEVKGRRDLVTVVDSATSVSPGEYLEATGLKVPVTECQGYGGTLDAPSLLTLKWAVA